MLLMFVEQMTLFDILELKFSFRITQVKNKTGQDPGGPAVRTLLPLPMVRVPVSREVGPKKQTNIRTFELY